MAAILIIGDSATTRSWAEALVSAGHSLESRSTAFEAQDRLAEMPVDILIVDIANADCAEAMLIPQARAAWPDCKIVVATPNHDFRSSAVYEMGLWSPDQVLLKPLNIKLLRATVSFLWAQIRTEKIRHGLMSRSELASKQTSEIAAQTALSSRIMQ